MLHEVLHASGKKVGLFTSPYVTTTTEKIRIGGKYIAVPEFLRLVEYVKPFIQKAQKGPYGGPSAFEIFFVIAVLYFKQQKCEWVVLEVGLGGRYDATNVIENPVITAITNIDYDHTEILGDTLREIATDKAGIIKPGSAFFTSEQRPTLLRLFDKTCREKGVKLCSIPRQKHYSEYNAELVRSICRHIGIPDKYIDRGIRNTALPCRFEIMQRHPIVILDGAHNRSKIRSTVANLKKLNFKKLYLIVSIADNKRDNRAILKPLMQMPYRMHVTLTRVSIGERKTLHPNVLVPVVERHKKKGTSVNVMSDSNEALRWALSHASKNDLILVTGSFFLAGELRKHWVSEETVLRKRSA
jgi:dihydrofolate synthase/folylpolyglutamate synthase